MIQAIIFDCFGVFYVDPVLAYVHDPSSSPEIVRALRELDAQAALGKLSRVEFNQQAAVLLHLSAAAVDRQFFQGMARNEELIAYAQSLRPQYKIGLLSNLGSDMMEGFFPLAERKQLFDVVVISGAVKLTKPDPAIFELTCQRLNVDPTEAVMIDDSEVNCTAARSLGMRSIHYQGFLQTKRDLEELLAIPKE